MISNGFSVTIQYCGYPHLRNFWDDLYNLMLEVTKPVFNRYLKVMFENPQTGHLLTPVEKL